MAGRGGGLLIGYRLLLWALRPFLPLLIYARMRAGKELKARRGERYGTASRPRPRGEVIWIHAASVGETRSVLPLIETLQARCPKAHILLTTVTVTAAQMVKQNARLTHQFLPLDHRRYCARFFAHWRPDMGVFVEAELWPNLLASAQASGVKLALINARMSEKSARIWTRFNKSFQSLTRPLALIAAQDEISAKRLAALGCADIHTPGNLKLDAPRLAVTSDALTDLRAQIGTRPLWLAASTHIGEEAIIAAAHQKIARRLPDILTIIVPRHPERGESIASMLAAKNLQFAQRSRGAKISKQTQIYLADTLGELGLFYRLADMALIGGSLVAQGGQNPLEALRLEAVVLSGASVQNFTEIYDGLRAGRACCFVDNAETLAAQIIALQKDKNTRARYIKAGHAFLAKHKGAGKRTADLLLALRKGKK